MVKWNDFFVLYIYIYRLPTVFPQTINILRWLTYLAGKVLPWDWQEVWSWMLKIGHNISYFQRLCLDFGPPLLLYCVGLVWGALGLNFFQHSSLFFLLSSVCLVSVITKCHSGIKIYFFSLFRLLSNFLSSQIFI